MVCQYFDHEYLIRKPLAAADEMFLNLLVKTINSGMPLCIGGNDYFFLSALSDLADNFNYLNGIRRKIFYSKKVRFA